MNTKSFVPMTANKECARKKKQSKLQHIFHLFFFSRLFSFNFFPLSHTNTVIYQNTQSLAHRFINEWIRWIVWITSQNLFTFQSHSIRFSLRAILGLGIGPARWKSDRIEGIHVCMYVLKGIDSIFLFSISFHIQIISAPSSLCEGIVSTHDSN